MVEQEILKMLQDYPLKGVIYNVVRRPLSGGKGSIVRHKPTKSNPQGESQAEYYQRVAAYIEEEPETYFMRWKIEVSPAEVLKFRQQCLDPILEQLCDWWEFISQCGGQPWVDLAGEHPGVHHRTPYGVWNVLLEGGSSDLDSYLDTGSTVGLGRAETLFPELEGQK